MTPLTSRVIRIAAASLLAGLLIGIVGGAFRFLLGTVDSLRNQLVYWAHAWPFLGWIFPVLLGAFGAGLARMLVVRFSPNAAGSGVQRVEAVIAGEVKPVSQAIVPVKFFGGLLAIGSGLALGREGPTVQMGASLASWVSRRIVRADVDHKTVEAAGAGAGLAVAFNAPISGSVFVFEELTSSFNPWLLIATLSAASVAVWLMRAMLGNRVDFIVRAVVSSYSWPLLPFLYLGALLGAIGVLYNRSTLALLRFADSLRRISSVYRAAAIGAVVGLVAWFAPNMVGGGDPLTQAILSERYTLEGVLVVFLVRLLIGPWSYMAGTPGGLFSPILVLGASFGALYAGALNHFLPTLGLSPVACGVVGMAALFSACVRAPLTGILLAMEMTGRADLTLGLLVGSLGAMLVAMLLRSEPIYESLKRRMLQQEMAAAQSPSGKVSWELRPIVSQDAALR